MEPITVTRGILDPTTLRSALATGKKVGPEVTGFLADDHRTVLGLLAWYEETDDDQLKAQIVKEVRMSVIAHMDAEEEELYPAVRKLDPELVQDSYDDHEEVKQILAQLESAVDDEERDDLMAELHDVLLDHIEDEETELFPTVRKTNLDLYAVGRAVAARRFEKLMELRGLRRGEKMPVAPAFVLRAAAHDIYIRGLRNAHSSATQGRTLLDAQADRLDDFPLLQAHLRAHIQKKDIQLRRLEDLLEDEDMEVSTLTDTAMRIAGNLTARAAGQDEVVYQTLATLAQAKYEAGMYETLILFAELAGEARAEHGLQEFLSQERALVAFIEENLAPIVRRYVQFVTEASV